MTLNIINSIGNNKFATVYLAEVESGRYLEFVESTPPPLTRKEKWVLIVSVLFGCPVGCLMCDAGGYFHGRVSPTEVLAQIDYLVSRHYPDKNIDSCEFKIQFARMGEPALNKGLLEVLAELPMRYQAPGLLPSISTVAPAGSKDFFSELVAIKNNLYFGGRFQLQFSLHSSKEEERAKIIPIKKWGLAEIASYGERFYCKGDKKISLNFALAKGIVISPPELKKYFSPDIFLIKITPINPTISALNNHLESYFVTGAAEEDQSNLVKKLQDIGYEVIVSIGDLEENQIGSNCGQYVRKFINNKNLNLLFKQGYKYAQF